MDFFARQDAARRTTRWLVLAYLASVVCIVVAIDAIIAVAVGITNPGVSPRGPVIFASIVVFAIVCGASLFKSLALRSGGGNVARSMGGSRVDRGTTDVALKRLHNVVEEMSIASGVTMPEVYVLEDEDGINAFAGGHSPADAAIVMTRGAVTRLRRALSCAAPAGARGACAAARRGCRTCVSRREHRRVRVLSFAADGVRARR